MEVKQTHLLPARTKSRTCFCSGESKISFDGVFVPPVVCSVAKTLLLLVLDEFILSVIRASLASAINGYMWLPGDKLFVVRLTRWQWSITSWIEIEIDLGILERWCILSPFCGRRRVRTPNTGTLVRWWWHPEDRLCRGKAWVYYHLIVFRCVMNKIRLLDQGQHDQY
jgi:hypothetical protein